ncbi:MAG: ATP-binding protein [Myxococcota bacterium]|nr:ATP-binding protein [Myxococcota bacterium]
MIPKTLLLRMNPWLEGNSPPLPTPYIHRSAEARLISWRDPKRILVITGPRQSGKSTLLRWFIAQQLSNGLDSPEAIIYLNADYPVVQELIGNPNQLLEYLDAFARGRPQFLLIDEIQRIPEPGLLLKQMVDLSIGIKIAVSGSSSLLIRSETREHLTGRKRDVLLTPFTFREIVAADPEVSDLAGASVGEIERRWPIVGPSLLKLSDRLAAIGGYPDVWLAEQPGDAEECLFDLYDSYVRKDVVDFLRVDNPAPFNRLVKLLALQVGSEINKSALAGEVGLPLRRIEHHLAALVDTHIATVVPPFFRNRRREIVKAPKVYFLDCGLRNVMLGQITGPNFRPDKGAAIENLVMSEVAKIIPPPWEQHYWRTQTGAEVDLVVVRGNRIWAAEIKSGSMGRRKYTRGFRNFMDTYNPVRAFILNRDVFQTAEPGTPQTVPIPAFLLVADAVITSP